jgi:hypothetical protein
MYERSEPGAICKRRAASDTDSASRFIKTNAFAERPQ